MTFGPTQTTTSSSRRDPTYPVLDFNSYAIEPRTLRPFAHSLGLTQPSCEKHPYYFAEHVLDQFSTPRQQWTNLSSALNLRGDGTQLIAMRELLERDYQDGIRDRLSASDLGGSSREKHAQLSRTATALAQGEVPNDLLTALRSSDLSRIVRPVIDKLTDIRGEYLSKRIPPHVGHGVRRTLAFEKPEVIQAEMDWEATQDRGSAASLLELMFTFVESGTRDSFVTLMRRYKCCGDWTFWLTTPPKEDAAHPEAEQVVANTLVMLYRLHQFTREYEEQYMKATPLRFARWHWFEPCEKTTRIDPIAYPLIASALEIFTRDDFKHL